MDKPKIVESPKNVTALTHENVTLSCSASGHPKPIITWQKKEGTNWQNLSGQHRVLQRGSLVLINVTFSVEGFYRCTASNHVKSVLSESAYVTVQEKLYFVRPLRNRTVSSGTDVVLVCYVTGTPQPTLTWFKNNKQLYDGGDGSGQPISTNTYRFTATETGLYNCTASNKISSISTSAFITVDVQGLYYDCDALPSSNVDDGLGVKFDDKHTRPTCLSLDNFDDEDSVEKDDQSSMSQRALQKDPLKMNNPWTSPSPSATDGINNYNNKDDELIHQESNAGEEDSTGALIGGIVGAIIAIVIIVIVFAVFFFKWRERKCRLPIMSTGQITIPNADNSDIMLRPLTAANASESLTALQQAQSSLQLQQQPFQQQSNSAANNNSHLGSYQLDRNSVVYESDIAVGAFGPVFKARLKGKTNIKIENELKPNTASSSATAALLELGFSGSGGTATGASGEMESDKNFVAVKVLREGCSEAVKQEFARQTSLIARLSHTNVIKLVGVCFLGSPLSIVVEYMAHRDLHSYLPVLKPAHYFHSERFYSRQLSIARQLASVLEHLKRRRFLHRDLAARNFLVSAENLPDGSPLVKLADFGLAVELPSNLDYYEGMEAEPIAVRWTAPEAIQHGYYSFASDVWSFGVLLWEVLSYGAHPFDHIKQLDEVSKYVRNGGRLDNPCPEHPEIGELMRQCWLKEHDKRCSAYYLSKSFDHLIDQARNSNC
ncbi:hypothetical protein HELRODRAFT_191035 [Helobdella robusta]|uniref:receptor protein-tyrosine kinase n=1 Tax=Helobdella robusta TaxID=6412 RepID=T1FSI9_HELRO|nr:hypothetical protein HELRODRAFT_191035 [Helobdella robusta]ESO07778.1 hypothetical protein HELRODRAFT_191035 [Helobdella robusta]